MITYSLQLSENVETKSINFVAFLDFFQIKIYFYSKIL